MWLGGLPLLLWHGLDPAYALGPALGASTGLLMAYASLLGSALAYGLFFWFANREELTAFTTLGFSRQCSRWPLGGCGCRNALNPPPVGGGGAGAVVRGVGQSATSLVGT